MNDLPERLEEIAGWIAGVLPQQDLRWAANQIRRLEEENERLLQEHKKDITHWERDIKTMDRYREALEQIVALADEYSVEQTRIAREALKEAEDE